VQDHQVGRVHRPGILGEIVDAPVKAPLDPCLPGELVRLVLVGRGELQVLGPRRARLQQLDLDLADAPADLQDAGAFDAALAQELDHRPGGGVEAALAVSVGEPAGEPLVEQTAIIARGTAACHAV
jgi:hypothetical protein